MKIILSIFSCVLCLVVFAGQVRSNIGAGHVRYSSSEETWNNPYVTDGLIGMWDGEWNVGGGLHDDSASVWADISGNGRDATLSGSYAWGDNYWYVESVSGRGLAKWDAQDLGDNQTIEFVLKAIRHNGYGRIIAEGPSVASPCYMSDYYVYMYGYNLDRGADIRSVIRSFSQTDMHLHQIVHQSRGQMYYYIDGVLVWTLTATGDSIGATYGYFANRPNYDRGIDAYYFTVRRYNRVLTEEELGVNYLVDKARFGL